MRYEIKKSSFPDGYCTDPDGHIVPPAGKHVDYNFGYEVGFADAWEIMNDAIKAADRARFEAGRIAKEIKKRREVPNAQIEATAL